MPASKNMYDNERLAEGYAFARPPVHPCVIALIAAHLQRRFARALDVGCGAGRSTDALAPLAEIAIGIDPFSVMLTHCQRVAPRAAFVVGVAETLPFQNHSFDLITAAGSLNYADQDLFLPNAARLLMPTGALVIYDFSAGKRLRDDPALETWFAEFARRYPSQSGYTFDVHTLEYARFGLRLDAYREFEIVLPLDTDAYLRYILSETNVVRAITRGESYDAIREWCHDSIARIFGAQARAVLFTGYIAYVKPG